MITKNIILFGGTFDPVHLGHTRVADFAAEKLNAEKLIFIPARRSPLKSLLPKASDTDRFNMISLAIMGKNKFEASDFELKKNSPNYTIETVNEFKKLYSSQSEIYWLVGADSVNELPYWYRIIELLDACNVSVMYRAGYPKPDLSGFIKIWGKSRVEKLQKNIIETPLINISSTEIRKLLSSSGDVSQMLNPEVLDYIRQNNLYR